MLTGTSEGRTPGDGSVHGWLERSRKHVPRLGPGSELSVLVLDLNPQDELIEFPCAGNRR